MKTKIVFLFLVFSIFVFASPVFASVHTILATPQVATTLVGVNSCDLGDVWLQYDAVGDYVTSGSCLAGAFTENTAQSDVLVECNSSAEGAVCNGTDATLTEAVADAGFIGQQDFVFSALETPAVSTEGGMCTAGQVCYFDWLIMNGFILFFLSLIVFYPVIKALFPHKDSR